MQRQERIGAEGGNRTRTALAGRGILSPLRLPVPPPPRVTYYTCATRETREGIPRAQGQFERFKTSTDFDGTARNPQWLG